MDVCFAGPKVTALDGVVKEAGDRVAVVLVILSCVDASLCGDGVCSPGTILVAEALHPVAKLGESGSCGTTCQPTPDNYDGKLPFVGRVDESRIHHVPGPLLIEGTGRNSTAEIDGHREVLGSDDWNLPVMRGFAKIEFTGRSQRRG